jgi:two-component system sensor histidine kinase/response regulator
MPEETSSSILIVDDEMAHTRALCETLQDRGYQTSGFASPRAALAAIEKGKYDLLLADLVMPDMDGIEFLEAARRKDADLEGIIMTGEGTIATAVEAMKSGAMDYILKPFKISAIVPVLERALTARRLRLENAMLERRIRQRTAELEAANKELEAFSYSVSHDLRAPLRHIDGFSAILKQNFLNEMPSEARRLLDIIGAEAQHMGKLIDDLLRFSRLSRQPLTREAVNVTDLAKEVLEELRGEHAERKIEVVVGTLPACQADRSLLRQVMTNLLSNAFKFTRQREVAVVEIGGRVEEPERLYYVRDNGAGFDMRYAQRLFGVFQRMHGQKDFEGTGVGLSIAQRIILRHGGHIWAEAAVNQGATFYFTVPG